MNVQVSRPGYFVDDPTGRCPAKRSKGVHPKINTTRIRHLRPHLRYVSRKVLRQLNGRGGIERVPGGLNRLESIRVTTGVSLHLPTWL